MADVTESVALRVVSDVLPPELFTRDTSPVSVLEGDVIGSVLEL